jgi:uracil-DNA glycosylase family 4
VSEIVIIGPAPDAHDLRAGIPFGGRVGRILLDAMAEAGLRREDVTLLTLSSVRPPRDEFRALDATRLKADIARTHETLRRLRPKVTVALGPYVAHALVPEWPDARSRDEGLVHRGNIFGATEIENRRGYVFDSPFGPVVATVDPAFVDTSWSPWRVLLSLDLQRATKVASDGIVRPTRDVQIIRSSRDASCAVGALRRQRVLASDIETWRDTSLACIGFAGESGKAYVFPSEYLDRASELLGDADLTTIWANGIYDLFVLKHRYGVPIRTRIDDVQVMWHAAYPELAGAREDKRKHRFTRKSLSFLASLSTLDVWWKGDYETQEEFFIYNGKDCAITLDVHAFTKGEVERVGAEDTYEHERGLIMPCVDMLARGLRVNEDLRRERVHFLTNDLEKANTGVLDEISPWLSEKRTTAKDPKAFRLFESVDRTCACCGHASKKQRACWSCVGFKSAPSKKDLTRVFGAFKGTKGEMEARFLPVCRVCGGAERETKLEVNLNSNHQMKALLFDILRLPKRASTDEATLKGLLAGISNET